MNGGWYIPLFMVFIIWETTKSNPFLILTRNRSVYSGFNPLTCQLPPPPRTFTLSWWKNFHPPKNRTFLLTFHDNLCFNFMLLNPPLVAHLIFQDFLTPNPRTKTKGYTVFTILIFTKYITINLAIISMIMKCLALLTCQGKF